MKCDLRYPTIVLAGAWNPAILQPGWVAQNLLGYPAGTEVQVLQVLQGKPPAPPKSIFFIDKIGFHTSTARAELFVFEFKKDLVEVAESIACKIAEILPHTPIVGIGINFKFIETEPDEGILDKIKVQDGLDLKMRITSEKATSFCDLGNSTLLRFLRTWRSESAEFDFNYHRDVAGALEVQDSVKGKVYEYFSQSTELINALYDVESEGWISFEDELPQEAREDIDGQEERA